ncbi:MAG: peptidyl-prolyl cis-trans isomerase [Proteobacteria bacterium]|nr:peptidyl-prolyl cis-trans isomerase [Pseudomonadota bacterium]
MRQSLPRIPLQLLTLCSLLATAGSGCTKKDQPPSAGTEAPRARQATPVAQAASTPAKVAAAKGPAAAATAGGAPANAAPPPPPGVAREVELTTTRGKLTIELYADKAPGTVANFAEYVRAGFYDGTIFHRVIDGFMIQGGGFDTSFTEKPTRAPIQNEANSGLRNERGTVAMARTSDPHSAGAQFFINVKDNAFLNHRDKSLRGWGYAVFGRVTKGMAVADAIAKLATGPKGPFPQDVPQEDVVLTGARVLR